MSDKLGDTTGFVLFLTTTPLILLGFLESLIVDGLAATGAADIVRRGWFIALVRAATALCVDVTGQFLNQKALA